MAQTTTDEARSEAARAQLSAGRAALQGGRFEEALALANQVLVYDSASSDALYLAAVACRYLERFDDGEALLLRLMAVIPEYGRAWQERGHLARARGQVEPAISAYARAVRYNPVLDASWRAQAELFLQLGRPAEAVAARAQAERIAALPRELVAAANHLHEGRLLRAEELCRHYLRGHPRDVEGMRLLAEIGARLGVLDDAEFLLESAVSFAPDNVQLRLDYMQMLAQTPEIRPRAGRGRGAA